MSYVIEQENDLLLLLLEKLYTLRRAQIIETDEAQRFKLSKQIEDIEKYRETIERRIEQLEKLYFQKHRNIIRDIERLLST